MPGKHRCGIYVIEQIGTDRFYIGSSANIENRWYRHRGQLNAGTHHSRFLQNAWTKHGATAFRFYVIDECDRVDLIDREQEYLEALQPAFNICPVAGSRLGARNTPEGLANIRRAIAERVAKIIACPKGHVYDNANTYRGKAGKRICRVCNAERVSGVYAKETLEQREARRQAVKAHYKANKPRLTAQMRDYAAARKEQKRAYDQARAALKREADHKRRAVANLTPEQLEAQRKARRDYYARDPERTKRQAHEHYIRRRDRLKETAI